MRSNTKKLKKYSLKTSHVHFKIAKISIPLKLLLILIFEPNTKTNQQISLHLALPKTIKFEIIINFDYKSI